MSDIIVDSDNSVCSEKDREGSKIDTNTNINIIDNINNNTNNEANSDNDEEEVKKLPPLRRPARRQWSAV